MPRGPPYAAWPSPCGMARRWCATYKDLNIDGTFSSQEEAAEAVKASLRPDLGYPAIDHDPIPRPDPSPGPNTSLAGTLPCHTLTPSLDLNLMPYRYVITPDPVLKAAWMSNAEEVRDLCDDSDQVITPAMSTSRVVVEHNVGRSADPQSCRGTHTSTHAVEGTPARVPRADTPFNTMLTRHVLGPDPTYP